MNVLETQFTRDAGVEVPMICGAMYPCSNPELIAAASEAGGMGIIQPISMMFVHGHDLREGIQYIRELTDKPVGFNALVEQSSKVYEERMKRWVDVALEEGVRFFVSALGSPDWVVEKVHAYGGKVYHDVTELKWARRALDGGVDGLICVNSLAGGHAGHTPPEQLYEELVDLGVPLIRAGGVGEPEHLIDALETGYAGVQMGTRFIATPECNAHLDYKDAIVAAQADDIVLSEKISGVPVAVIETPYVEKVGTEAGWLAKKLLQHPRGKHLMRSFYSIKSLFQLRSASLDGGSYQDYWQAGKSVEGIDDIELASEIVERFALEARAHFAAKSSEASAA
ncbi:MAG: NAD(P)H-dependent flavin oxidoreductase [Myxococcota bacterium]